MVRDPVCDMDIEMEDAESRGLVSEHGGKQYHFCSAGCKRLFDDDPSAYAAHDLQGESDDGAGEFPSAGE